MIHNNNNNDFTFKEDEREDGTDERLGTLDDVDDEQDTQ